MEKVDQIISKYRGDSTALIRLLQDINREFRYLPKEALERVAEKLNIPLSQLYSMATFYKSFKLTPGGQHEIHVCMGTACHVRGSQKILETFSQKLSIQPGETTSDGQYTLETVNCLGACALGPLVTIDGKYSGNLKPKDAEKLLGGLYEKNSESR
ncbi:MAG: NAD(P)H-dependent oxidoreductase subunit E [Dehalobacterium sp.]